MRFKTYEKQTYETGIYNDILMKRKNNIFWINRNNKYIKIREEKKEKEHLGLIIWEAGPVRTLSL